MNAAAKLPPDKDVFESKAYSAYSDLESEIRNLEAMAGITAQMAHDLIDSAPDADGVVTLRVGNREHGRLMFAIYHVRDMVDDLVELYDAKWPHASAAATDK
jgi:hypothetical protein